MVVAGAAATADLWDNFSTIDALCRECSDLIEHHDLISQLTSAVPHLGVVIEEAQNVQAIPSRASEVQQILDDPQMDMRRGRCSVRHAQQWMGRGSRGHTGQGPSLPGRPYGTSTLS